MRSTRYTASSMSSSTRIAFASRGAKGVPDERAQQREVSASQHTLRASSAENARGRCDAARIATVHERAGERLARERRERGTRGRSVIAHDVRTRRECGVERGDVGVADDRLRPARDGVEVDRIENAHRAVPSAQAPHRIDRIVRQRPVEVRGAQRIIAGEIALARAARCAPTMGSQPNDRTFSTARSRSASLRSGPAGATSATRAPRSAVAVGAREWREVARVSNHPLAHALPRLLRPVKRRDCFRRARRTQSKYAGG